MKSIYSCCFILFSTWATAQTNLAKAYKNLQNTPINSLSIQNGTQVIVGTEQGLFKISDFEADALKLTNQAVTKMDYDANNQAWLGLYSNQIASVRKELYDIGISKTNLINALKINGNTVWVGTNNGLFSFSLKKMKEMPHFTSKNSKLAGNQINAIESDAKGQIWIGTNRGLSIFDGKKWETFHKGKQVTAIRRNGNTMWTAVGKTIQSYNGKNWTSIAMPINYAFHPIRDLAFDYNGNLWIASQHVLKYEMITKTFFVFDNNTGFSSSMALCLAIDKDNQVWVGTAGKGLFKIKNERTEQILANKPEAAIETVVSNQPPSKPSYEEVMTNKGPEIKITDKPKKEKNSKAEKPKRKRFSIFNNSTKQEDTKADFSKDRQTQKVKQIKNNGEKANINFLGSRLIKDGASIDVEEMQIEIAIWDGQNMDGDSVSLYYNGVCILKNYNLTKERQYFKLDINPRIDNTLILYAHSNGDLGYSTATIAVEGKDTPTKWIVLNSDMKKCDRISFKFVY